MVGGLAQGQVLASLGSDNSTAAAVAGGGLTGGKKTDNRHSLSLVVYSS